MDVMTPTQRHRAMASNRGRTRPERALASALWHEGIRYLTHEGYKSLTNKNLIGKPDMIFSRKRIALFVDGCFWHGCQVCNKSPDRSGEFWINKIRTNRKRDQRVTATLESEGWKVVRIPEHEVRTKTALMLTVQRLMPLLSAKDQIKEVNELELGRIAEENAIYTVREIEK